MKLTLETVLSVCIASAIYPYVTYPLLLWLLCRNRKAHEPLLSGDLPSVTVIIPCHNEEAVIRRKIENTLECLVHTRSESQVIVVSDGSTDHTCDTARDFVPRIKLIELPTQSGILGAFRTAMREVSSQVVVFSDADIIVGRDTFARLLAHYYDPRVGGVCGFTGMNVQPGSGLGAELLNVGLRTRVRYWQSILHSSIGADGSNWSVRRDLVSLPRRPVIGDDLVIPLEVVRQGYRYILDPVAMTTETSAPSITHEFRRKIRTIAGGIQAGVVCSWMFSPKYLGTAFHYASWKLGKYLAPVWGITALICLLGLSRYSHFFLNMSYVICGTVAMVAISGLISTVLRGRSPAVFAAIWHGFLAFTALVFSVVYLVQKSGSGTWKMTPRAEVAEADTPNSKLQ